MLTRLSRWILVVTLALSLGAHWAILQSVAWVGMLVTYSRDASIFDAVSKTFDGEHPCKLCKEIQKGRGEEKKQDNETVKPGYKLELGVLWNPLSIAFDHYPKQVTTFQIVVESKSEEPPTPPPKLLSSDYLV